LRGLEWHTRYEIIVGICKGLLHLHKEKHIIHMDLKPANILLDDQMVPKITDFGISRLDRNSCSKTTSLLISLYDTHLNNTLLFVALALLHDSVLIYAVIMQRIQCSRIFFGRKIIKQVRHI
jgi:serine/threonine protein kinase